MKDQPGYFLGEPVTFWMDLKLMITKEGMWQITKRNHELLTINSQLEAKIAYYEARIKEMVRKMEGVV